MTHAMTLRLDDDLYEWLRQESFDRHTSISAQIRGHLAGVRRIQRAATGTTSPAITPESAFREAHADAKQRNERLPDHARMVITDPALSAHRITKDEAEGDFIAHALVESFDRATICQCGAPAVDHQSPTVTPAAMDGDNGLRAALMELCREGARVMKAAPDGVPHTVVTVRAVYDLLAAHPATGGDE